MNRITVISACVVLLLTQMAWAGHGAMVDDPTPYAAFGLYEYENRLASTVCADSLGTVEFWFFIYVPWDGDGMKAIEIRTEPSSSNFIIFSPVYNPDIELTWGGIPGDLSALYSNCHFGWTHILNASLLVLDTAEHHIDLAPATGCDYPKILDCLQIERAAMIYTGLTINDPFYCGVIGVEESTWGAIKNMYK